MSGIKNISEIVGTLKYGVFIGVTKRKAALTYFIIVAVWVLIVAATIAVICAIQFSSDFSTSIDYFIIELVLIPIACSVFPALFLVACVRNDKSRREITKWLDDALELEAYSTGIVDLDSGVSQTLARIQIDFDFGGERLSRVSEGRMIGDKTSPEGYHAIWADYADRKIKILYSPKYDQVMVLKD